MDALAVDKPATVQSLAELRERHLALLRAWSVLSATNSTDATGESGSPADAARETDLAGEAEALREAAAALGAWLDDPDERDRAQGMIDYWTAALGALPGTLYPEMLQLAPFDPALPAAAVARAEALLAEHEGTARAADADAILLRLVRPGPGDTIVCQPPLDRAFLEHADGVTDMTASQDELIDSLVDAGVIRKISGETAELDKFDFMHGSIARACPRLKALLDRRRNVNATRDKLRATAQLWKDSSHDRGYLLAGPVLDDAVRYQGDDGLLDEFIRASRDADERGKRFRLMLWTSLTTILVILLAAIGLAYLQGKNTGFDLGNSLGFEKGDRQGREVGARIGAGSGVMIASEAPDAVADIANEDPGRIPAETPPARPPGAPGIPGWIWVGDNDIRLLRWLDTREPVDPARIRPGIAYRTRTRIRLRAAAPGPESDPEGDLGLMPPSSLVVATGSPQRIVRGRIPQYWLPVTMVPRLRVQYMRPDSQALADIFAARLREEGLDVDAPGLNDGQNVTPLLNYFRKDDGRIAVQTVLLVAGALQRPNGMPPTFPCALVANPNVGTGVLDLTLDLQGLSRRDRAPPTRPPPPECH